MIECKKYTTQEFYKILDIPRATWNRRQEKILEYLKNYFDYSIEKKGQYIYYIIHKQFQEWEGLPRKSDTKKKIDFYKVEVDKVIKEDPWSCPADITKKIFNTNNKYNHKEDTIRRYVVYILKNDYTQIQDAEWCYQELNTLKNKSLSQEQKQKLNQIITQQPSDADFITNVLDDKFYKRISKEQAQKLLLQEAETRAKKIFSEFEKEFGFIPRKLCKYEKKKEE